jgi:hypothetical protein
MTTLVHVKTKLVPLVLDAIGHWLRQIIETDPEWMTEQHVVEKLLRDDLQLHLAVDDRNVALAAMVTELKETSTGMKVCFIHGISGVNRHLWMGHLSGMEAWAKREGCRRMIVARGRKGWLRAEELKPYRVTYSFERELA